MEHYTVQVQQNILNCKTSDTNQIIEDLDIVLNNPFAALLANALNDYFYDLKEEILTEDILDENDIIKLI